MSHYSNTNPTQNFRPKYNVNPTNSQSQQYQQHQAVYQQMPSGTYGDLRREAAPINARREEYEIRKSERERVEMETTTARMERRDRTDPDIKRVRNARNREEKSLGKLERAQRSYNDSAASSSYANTINANHSNMTRVASNNTMPNEMVGSVTRHVDVPAYPQRLPAPRRQKEDDYHYRRDTYH